MQCGSGPDGMKGRSGHEGLIGLNGPQGPLGAEDVFCSAGTGLWNVPHQSISYMADSISKD